MTARTEKTEQAYQEARARGDLQALDEIEPIREWTHWKLVENRFPHDKLNCRHFILALKRKVAPEDYWGLTEYELYELWWDIFPEVDNEFHYVKINLAELRSVNNVPHLHLCDHLPEFV
jgi:hypothetical protein